MAERIGTCQDCSATFTHEKVTGRVPKRCESCREAVKSTYRKRSYQRHRDKRLAEAAIRWRRENPREVVKPCQLCGRAFTATGQGRTQRKFCDECVLIRHREAQNQFKARNKARVRDEAREYARNRRATDPEYLRKNREYAAARLAEDPERVRAVARAWRDRHPGVMREHARRWKLANPEKAAETDRRCRARRLNAPLGEPYTRSYIFERDGGRCHICGGRCDPKRFEIDHLVPIARGGAECATNVALAHPSCNRKRSAGYIPAQLRLVG